MDWFLYDTTSVMKDLSSSGFFAPIIITQEKVNICKKQCFLDRLNYPHVFYTCISIYGFTERRKQMNTGLVQFHYSYNFNVCQICIFDYKIKQSALQKILSCWSKPTNKFENPLKIWKPIGKEKILFLLPM